jgi:hypothetical protein
MPPGEAAPNSFKFPGETASAFAVDAIGKPRKVDAIEPTAPPHSLM